MIRKEGINMSTEIPTFAGIVPPTIKGFGEKMKEEGIKEGQKKTQNEIALEMLKEDTSIEFIAKVTKLSIEEIKLLQEKLQ
jgi:predicted transposase/invertase (TIGR01784 family)